MAKARIINKTAFKPVIIEVELENQKELDLFGTIFNYVPFCEVSMAGWCTSISRAAEEAGGDISTLIKVLDKKFQRR